MRLLPLIFLLVAFSLSACGSVDNTFTVSDPEGMATSAELRLCGKSQNLGHSNQNFATSVPITCEADGAVLVHLANGETTSCVVGYVTPGAVQRFDFLIKGTQCLPIEPKS